MSVDEIEAELAAMKAERQTLRRLLWASRGLQALLVVFAIAAFRALVVSGGHVPWTIPAGLVALTLLAVRLHVTITDRT